MPAYTLYDSATGEITGIVEVRDVAALAVYTPAGTSYVVGAFNPATLEIDTVTGVAQTKTETINTAKDARLVEVEVVTVAKKAAMVTTTHGDFPAHELGVVTAYLTAALADASYTVTWVFDDDTTIVLDKAKLITVQKALVDQVSGAEVDALTARGSINGALTLTDVEDVVIPDGGFYDPDNGLDPDVFLP